MTTHYMTTLDNVTFTRTTANRTYTHMVVGKTNIAQARVNAEKSARTYWETSLSYMQERAEGKHPAHITPVSGFHESYGMADPVKYAAYVAECDKQSAKRVVDALAWLAIGEEGLVAQYLADFDARRAKSTNISADGQDFLWDAGWCGRLDLAHKLAAKTPRAVVLEVVEVPKAVKTKRAK